MISFSCSN